MSEEKKQYDVANRTSALGKMASRLGCEPGKLLSTLKATCFKGDVTNEQMMALTIVANQYQLNPFTKELYAFPDKSGGIVPVVGVDGWARIINEHPQFDGMEFVMSADGSECVCRIYRKDRAHAIEVVEYLAECKRNTDPWRTSPRRMLRHKAMIQCARYAFGFAGIYDPDEAERIVAAQDVEVADAAQKPTLAEIVNAKAKELEPLEAVPRRAVRGDSASEDAAEDDALSDELPL